MALQDKYQAITNAALQAGITDLQVREQSGVLYIDGTAPSGSVKDQLWDIYGQIDPNFTGGDLILDVKVAANANVTRARVTTDSSNLNIRKGPGTDQPIVGKAAKDEVITVVSQGNPQWWLVRTADGEEGYAYATYLTAEA
ncbi:MAG: SH3 domain-containing protein [Sphingobacteriales bacterium]|jgi:uncharacterized protein YgiM (DUF1202 family)|nr:SH3 domain-containing protein [Sphingobacteriales bacterium]